MTVAVTRPMGPELHDCELTHVDRVPIDIDRAVQQHDDYLAVLRSLKVDVVELPRLPNHPDAVFVEDTALVLPEVAVILLPGAPERQGETPSMAAALADYRDLLEDWWWPRSREPAMSDTTHRYRVKYPCLIARSQ